MTSITSSPTTSSLYVTSPCPWMVVSSISDIAPDSSLGKWMNNIHGKWMEKKCDDGSTLKELDLYLNICNEIGKSTPLPSNQSNTQNIADSMQSSSTLLASSSSASIQITVPSECIEQMPKQYQSCVHPEYDDYLRLEEQGVLLSAWILIEKKKDVENLRSLMKSSLFFFNLLPKARVAKLIRIVIDAATSLPLESSSYIKDDEYISKTTILSLSKNTSLTSSLKPTGSSSFSISSLSEAASAAGDISVVDVKIDSKATLAKLSAEDQKLTKSLFAICEDFIIWCQNEKRTFLKHRIETHLAQVYLQVGELQKGHEILRRLVKDVKKLDDKLLLVEIYLIEAFFYFQIMNFPKSKASLTAACTNANAIHCPPLLQGDIDLMAGILHAQEKDPKTAFSYFFESFEAFSANEQSIHHRHQSHSSPCIILTGSQNKGRALQALQYMILCKILMHQHDEVTSILTGKQGLRYYIPQSSSTTGKNNASAISNESVVEAGKNAITKAKPSQTKSLTNRSLEALRQVALCHKNRSLKEFERVINEYRYEIEGDIVIKKHIESLCDTLLEQNILKILKPFSKIQVTHICKLIDLPLDIVTIKLAEMILDKKLCGTLDEGSGILILFDYNPLPEIYNNAVATIKNMASVVDTLYDKAQQAL